MLKIIRIKFHLTKFQSTDTLHINKKMNKKERVKFHTSKCWYFAYLSIIYFLSQKKKKKEMKPTRHQSTSKSQNIHSIVILYFSRRNNRTVGRVRRLELLLRLLATSKDSFHPSAKNTLVNGWWIGTVTQRVIRNRGRIVLIQFDSPSRLPLR